MKNPETPNAHTNSPDNPKSWGEAGDLARGNPQDKKDFNGRFAALGGGDSGGGAYPNPHTGKEGEGSDSEGFMGHGGQSEMPYTGGGQLGDKQLGGNANAPAAKTKPGKSRD